MRRLFGTGIERDGLYYLDNGAGALALFVSASSKYELLLYYHRLGHISSRLCLVYFPLFLHHVLGRSYVSCMQTR
jgi:hypothetical protein